MSVRDPFRLFAGLLTIVLAAGCSPGSSETTPAYSPPAPAGGMMLTAQDAPGATGVTWHENLIQFTSCPGLEKLLVLSNSRSYDFSAITAEYPTGNSTVYETAVLNVSTPSPNEHFEKFKNLITSCDGRQSGAYHTVISTPFQVTENFAATPAADLPDGLIGFTSLITADDGTDERTIQRIYAPVITNSHEPGIIVLTTVSDTDSPGAPAPLDLLDAALRRAGATVSSTAFSSPSPDSTTSTP